MSYSGGGSNIGSFPHLQSNIEHPKVGRLKTGQLALFNGRSCDVQQIAIGSPINRTKQAQKLDRKRLEIISSVWSNARRNIVSKGFSVDTPQIHDNHTIKIVEQSARSDIISQVLPKSLFPDQSVKIQGAIHQSGDHNAQRTSSKATKVATETINSVSNNSFSKIASGKAKQVWKHSVKNDVAYFTPIKSGFFSAVYNAKEAEIREEVKTVQSIKRSLKNASPSEDIEETNLALELEELHGPDRIGGQYTVKTSRASSDLEKSVRDQGSLVRFPKSAELGLEILNGMNTLHKAGFVHGDIKLENVLVYHKDGTLHAKISDFGKTKPLKDGANIMNTGNPRYAAPEGRLSKQGEVYSTAIMLIRTLEGEFLNEKEDALIPIDTKKLDRTESACNTQGIEKFLVLNKHCVQTSAKKVIGKIRYWFRSVTKMVGIRGKEELGLAQQEVSLYIDALIKRLENAYANGGNDTKKRQALRDLKSLLERMTDSDPSKRPTMQKAYLEYKGVLEKLDLEKLNRA